METKTTTPKTDREKELDELLKNGEFGVMTECAYGTAIADTEIKKKVNVNVNNNDTSKTK